MWVRSSNVWNKFNPVKLHFVKDLTVIILLLKKMFG